MIFLSKPFFNDEELKAIQETFDSGWVAGQGPQGLALSSYIKEDIAVKHAIPVNNCTAGLHLALLAIGIKEGDEVIVSDFTFPATGHAVLYCGAIPRFVDVDLYTYNIDPDKIKAKINSKTKAIIVVHAFGLMADMDQIKSIADEYGLKIIEDAACAMGAKYSGKNVGSFGDITCFSLHGRKNVTSGEGGVNVTNNDEYAQIMASLSCFGMSSAYSRQTEFAIPSFETLGYNYKLSDINSAIALVQLKRYPKVLERKRELVAVYNNFLRDNEFLTTPVEPTNFYHVYQSYVVCLDSSLRRNDLIVSLKRESIQCQIGTYASHIQPVYNSADECPNSLTLYHQTLALPLYFELTEEQIATVCSSLNTHIKEQKNG
ncbi:DegT/DnrJ/EryC1/StrS aminotransferase family protein [Daejeonella sp.]|uniref:DegT/DnrJ/EryC1/StrS family aminotransferase n=1 Tax=Daejeonella sp. TaxID=2805397 RepID=UPI00272F4C5A|nr:DegT/DnrJ/EryC1/StrS family aminotransferase [Daejeonella sp.]MDP2414345.1 DegT/DnrJ/EryC1/StrS family aminotransferase [Daejeonella sp.]